jgi:hypothetical protein
MELVCLWDNSFAQRLKILTNGVLALKHEMLVGARLLSMTPGSVHQERHERPETGDF